MEIITQTITMRRYKKEPLREIPKPQRKALESAKRKMKMHKQRTFRLSETHTLHSTGQTVRPVTPNTMKALQNMGTVRWIRDDEYEFTDTTHEYIRISGPDAAYMPEAQERIESVPQQEPGQGALPELDSAQVDALVSASKRLSSQVFALTGAQLSLIELKLAINISSATRNTALFRLTEAGEIVAGLIIETAAAELVDAETQELMCEACHEHKAIVDPIWSLCVDCTQAKERIEPTPKTVEDLGAILSNSNALAQLFAPDEVTAPESVLDANGVVIEVGSIVTITTPRGKLGHMAGHVVELTEYKAYSIKVHWINNPPGGDWGYGYNFHYAEHLTVVASVRPPMTRSELIEMAAQELVAEHLEERSGIDKSAAHVWLWALESKYDAFEHYRDTGGDSQHDTQNAVVLRAKEIAASTEDVPAQDWRAAVLMDVLNHRELGIYDRQPTPYEWAGSGLVSPRTLVVVWTSESDNIGGSSRHYEVVTISDEAEGVFAQVRCHVNAADWNEKATITSDQLVDYHGDIFTARLLARALTIAAEIAAALEEREASE